MTIDSVVMIVRDALMAAFWLSAPILIIGFVVGIAVSLVQIVTSIQDAAFNTVPRLAAVLVGRPYTNAVELTAKGLQVRTSDFGAFCGQIAVLTRDHDIALRELLPTDESLESVFTYLVET